MSGTVAEIHCKSSKVIKGDQYLPGFLRGVLQYSRDEALQSSRAVQSALVDDSRHVNYDMRAYHVHQALEVDGRWVSFSETGCIAVPHVDEKITIFG
jgi:hypothetical protein